MTSKPRPPPIPDAVATRVKSVMYERPLFACRRSVHVLCAFFAGNASRALSFAEIYKIYFRQIYFCLERCSTLNEFKAVGYFVGMQTQKSVVVYFSIIRTYWYIMHKCISAHRKDGEGQFAKMGIKV